MEQIKKNLAELDFSHNEIKIYLTLTTLGESTASQIAKKAEMPRTTAISLLEKLTQKGFFSKHVYKGTTYYWVEAPRVLEEVYANKVEAAHQLAGYLRNIYRTEHAFPFVEVYDTAKTIRNFIEKLLIGLKKNSVIYTIDLPNLGNYHKIFSDQYSEIFLGLKRKKNVLTKTLIPAGTFVSINPKKLKTQNILIKELPKSISFSASLWLINNFLVLFSGQPPFVVVVSHQVIVESCQSLYRYLWEISLPKN
ncbi:MAG TPA: helix-turn-helix domain-containing protein [Candidatus Magasanikbacteria bacterium]|nr:helix-turn-helix domain-containing protein [Candidatus Magasanikbacteria bacterium]